MAKRRSFIQKAQSHNNLRQINGHTPALPTDTCYLPELEELSGKLTKEQIRSSDLARRLRNTTKQVSRLMNTSAELRADRRRSLHTARVQKSRAITRKENAVQKALVRAKLAPAEVYLKEKGVVKDNYRGMLRDLAGFNVPIKHVDSVVQGVVEGFGIELKDCVSSKTVARTVKEGGVASGIQLIHEIQQAKGITLSGDGTTIRHRNVESQHGFWEAKGYAADSDEPRQVTRTFGISMAPDHTNETQLRTWKLHEDKLIGTYNASPFGQLNLMDTWTFAAGILGLMTDHAADQKKLAKLLLGWKIRALEGRRFMEEASVADIVPVILEENEKKVQRAGGITAWGHLPEAEQRQRDKETCEILCARFGEAAWAAFSGEEQGESELFVWAGCCMRKEMNSVKYGVRRMSNHWVEKELTVPVQFMNRGNAAAAGAGPSKARENAIEASHGGVIKLTSLAGAVFQHKDDKKGQQDTYRIYFEANLDFRMPRFPDASNTRFGSRREAASELLVHLPLFLEFMLLVCDKKESRSLNHMESNAYEGLQDISTLTELAVLASYSQAISHPHMRVVRAAGETRVNAIMLGPLHEEVRTHCVAVIAKPTLLLAADASFETGSLRGENWERPEVFYTVQRLAPQLPHIEGCLVVFFEGALDAWNRFSSEFKEDSIIANLTETEKCGVFIPATNDANEGLLGQRRCSWRRAPRMTASYFNAVTTYERNETDGFIRAKLAGEENQAYLRKEAHVRDASGEEKYQRMSQALHDQKCVEVKREKDAQKRAKKDVFEREIDRVDPLPDPELLRSKLRDKRFTAAHITRQPDWNRRYGKAVLQRSLITKMSREDKLTHLIVLVEAYIKLPQPVARIDTAANVTRRPEDIPMRADWEEKEAIEEDVNDDQMQEVRWQKGHSKSELYIP